MSLSMDKNNFDSCSSSVKFDYLYHELEELHDAVTRWIFGFFFFFLIVLLVWIF